MAELDLPGFRFHPTEEELLEFYLKKMVFKKKFRFDIIGFLNIYHHDPWDLPGLAKIGEREWYFFVPRDRKQGNGGRPNRTTLHGFWKATGSDRQVRSLNDPKKVLGLRKTLVFYKGRAPRGCRTDWVMNEYRMPDTCTVPKDDIVLCKIYRKATSLKVLEERAAMEVESKTPEVVSPSSSGDVIQQFSDEQNNLMTLVPLAKNDKDIVLKAEVEDSIEEFKEENAETTSKAQSLHVEFALPDLQLPKPNMDWTQDSFWTQFQSPWLLGSLAQYADLLNFQEKFN